MENQIEEMAKIIADNFDGYDGKKYEPYDFEWCAYMLHEKGYLKVEQGEWVYHESIVTDDGLISGYSCSVCNALVNEEIFDTDEFHKNYCGNCGSKMKGNLYE